VAAETPALVRHTMTRPLLLFTAALLALTADIARAQSPGFNLSWNDCAASLAGGLSATSACTSNTETTKNLYGSYALPPGGAQAIAGNDIVMDIDVAGSALPCWWNFTVSPRSAGYAMTFNTPCADAPGVGILDYWSSIPGGPSGSASAMLVSGRPTRIRITATVAVDPAQARPVTDGIEIYSFTFQLKFDAAVGTCTGCLTPACFMLRLIRVTQSGYPDIELTYPSSRDFVVWQSAAVSAPGCPPVDDTPVLNKTWGAVKALYR